MTTYEPPFALLSTRQAAARMGVSLRHVPRVLSPAVVLDGRPYWAEPDVLSWRRKGARVASPPAGAFQDDDAPAPAFVAASPPCPGDELRAWAVAGVVSCCRCCEAAAERGELDHQLGDDCPYPPCDFHGQTPAHPDDAEALQW